MRRVVSEEELRRRLSSRLSAEEIEDLVCRHTEGPRQEQLPDMTVITDLAQKSRTDSHLRVSFRLDSDQYDALVAYWQESDPSATQLVKKTIDAFIKMTE